MPSPAEWASSLVLRSDRSPWTEGEAHRYPRELADSLSWVDEPIRRTPHRVDLRVH
jgi:hypothetical protein